MKNRMFKLSILIIEISFFLMVFIFNFECIFKRIFNIYCPSCGMTRAFIAIIKFDFIKAIDYNILSVPLFLFLIIINLSIIFDIVLNSKFSNKIIVNLRNYYYIVIISLIISTLVNNF